MAACQEEPDFSNSRIYPNVIRTQQEDGSFKVDIQKTNFEIIHFNIVDKLQFIPPPPQYNSDQFNPSSPSTTNDENILPLSPPPLPYKLMRSFRESDRPIYDPLYWNSINKQDNYNSKKYLLRYNKSHIYDYKINNWRTRILTNYVKFNCLAMILGWTLSLPGIFGGIKLVGRGCIWSGKYQKIIHLLIIEFPVIFQYFQKIMNIINIITKTIFILFLLFIDHYSSH